MTTFFTPKRKAQLLALMVLPPLLYGLYLHAVLPPATLRKVPLPLIAAMLLPIVPVFTNIGRSVNGNEAYLGRVKDNPNYRKLMFASAGLLGLMWCFLLQQYMVPDAKFTKLPAAAMAVFLVLLGNYQAALSQPAHMDLTFTTPFMRQYGDLVARAYRWAARLLFVGGLVGLVAVWQLPAEEGLVAVVSLELAAGLVAFLCFWGWWLRRQQRSAAHK